MASADAASAPAAAGGEPLHIVSWNVASWATAHRVIAAREGGFAAWWASHPPPHRERERALCSAARSPRPLMLSAGCRATRAMCWRCRRSRYRGEPLWSACRVRPRNRAACCAARHLQRRDTLSAYACALRRRRRVNLAPTSRATTAFGPRARLAARPPASMAWARSCGRGSHSPRSGIRWASRISTARVGTPPSASVHEGLRPTRGAARPCSHVPRTLVGARSLPCRSLPAHSARLVEPVQCVRA